MDRVVRIPRTCVSPQLVHDAIEADDSAAMHEQQCQEREHPAARDASVPATRKFDLIGPRILNWLSTLCELSPGCRAMKAF